MVNIVNVTNRKTDAQKEYEDILKKTGHDPDRRNKLLDNLRKRNPNFDRDFAEARKKGQGAVQNVLEKNFPGFKYNPNGAPLVTQISAFLQGDPKPVSIGFSGTLLGLTEGVVLTGGRLKHRINYTPLMVAGASFDLSIGSGVEISVGSSKHSSVGILLRRNNESRISVGGVAIHIGAGKGSPINVSGQVGENSLNE